MPNSVALKVALLLPLALTTVDAVANKRGVRVDNSNNWNIGSIGSVDCPGTSASSILVTAFGYTFSGRASTATEDYTINDYCEVAVAGTLNQTDYFHDDETGLRTLFGSGVGISGIRYDFLDNADLFSADGFQWGFYSFPSGATLVALYGLDGSINNIVPDSTSYIKKAATTVWSGSNGYNGEYFCFQNNAYIGSWDGNPSDTNSACLQAVGVVFISGFDN